MKKLASYVLISVFGLAVVGCGGETPEPVASGPLPVPKIDFKPNAPAGIPISVGGPESLAGLIALKSPVSRTDPFALLPAEGKFETAQLAESVVENAGGFSFIYEAPPVVDTTPVMEPQPYRRLAGILVADSVTALIDMGDGQPMQIVRPGQTIGEWTVVSIDEDKAVLRRSGNKLPREIVVRLESPDVTRGGGSTPPPNQGGGNRGGGRGGRGGPPAGGGPGSGNQDL